MKNRIIYIDYLKVIGLLCIILAHVCSNQYIFQIRNFDVPLMVMVSGFLAVGSLKRSMEKNNSILNYYSKRISRLLFPTWIFLTIYFIIMIIILKTPFDLKVIVRSFLLLDGIGYVWIIRVYLICAFIAPLICYLNRKIKNNRLKIIIALIIYILYELFVFFNINESNIIFEFIIAYAIPIGAIFILGMITTKTTYKTDRNISLIFLTLFFISAFSIYLTSGQFEPTQTMKYPPTIYYISYALFMSFLLFSISKKVNLKSNKIIEFCSKSSLWIYLWHILFLIVIPMIIGEQHWTINYILIVISAISLTFIQNKLIDLLETKSKSPILKLFRG